MAIYFLPPVPFGSGVRLTWAYGGVARDVIAPDLPTARAAVAAALARLRDVPELVPEDEPTKRAV